MLSFSQIFFICLFHYIADFHLQTHWQASNKSKNIFALGAHVGVYTLCFVPLGIYFLGPYVGLFWVAINSAIHFVIDYITSRISSKRWAEQRWHDFFDTIGFDQLLHYTTLFYTLIEFQSWS